MNSLLDTLKAYPCGERAGVARQLLAAAPNGSYGDF